MGFNTVAVVLNDALGTIGEDKDLGRRLVDAIRGYHDRKSDRHRAEVSARSPSGGIHVGAIQIVSQAHGLISVSPKDVRAARDLYQRLQAEKEGGRHLGALVWVVIVNGVIHAVYARPELAEDCALAMRRQSRMSSVLEMCLINQEGGDAAASGPASADRPHVAPPASATAGTGRATLRHPNINHRLREWHEKFTTTGECSDALVAGLLCAAEEIEALRNDNRVVRSIALAEGERIGIEKSAKVADEAATQHTNPVGSDYDQGAVDCAHHIERQLRALNTGDKPEVDPNAWAFKHGLEST